LGEICSPKDEFDDEDLHIYDNFCDTPTCFESFLLPKLESTYSSHGHKTKDIEDMESFSNHVQYMDDGNFEDQILKHLEEVIVEVIVRELHHENDGYVRSPIHYLSS
jgi:hypothetical protein